MGSGGGVLVAAGVSHAGRARLAIRLMCSLLYLKHAFNLSDEETCERWAENVVWQYFSTVQEKAIAYVRFATNSIWALLISRQRPPHSPSQTGIQAFTG